MALKLEINSWRWKGVPPVFSELPPPANYFRFRVTPDLMIAKGAMNHDA